MKLGLGTVQFGQPYGIAHKGSATPQDQIERILAAAADAGIDCLDTAPLYEDSERRLGIALDGLCFRIVTKTSAAAGASITRADVEALRSTFLRSLERLRQARVYGLLVHHAGDVLKPGGDALLEAMRELKREGLVEKIGVSVYTAAQLDGVLEAFDPDLVQLPLNVLDQRFITSGHLERLRARRVEVHARSIFLQGLLLMEPSELPAFFAPLVPTLDAYAAELSARRLSRVDGALAFVRGTGVDYAIVGVQDGGQLGELLRANGTSRQSAAVDFARFAVTDETMILPPRWNT